MEMMDNPADQGAEAFVGAGYPVDAAALLIVELDGPAAEVDYLIERVGEIARERGATRCRQRATSRSACPSGPAARRRSPPPAGSRPTICAWTAPSRAAGWSTC